LCGKRKRGGTLCEEQEEEALQNLSIRLMRRAQVYPYNLMESALKKYKIKKAKL